MIHHQPPSGETPKIQNLCSPPLIRSTFFFPACGTNFHIPFNVILPPRSLRQLLTTISDHPESKTMIFLRPFDPHSPRSPLYKIFRFFFLRVCFCIQCVHPVHRPSLPLISHIYQSLPLFSPSTLLLVLPLLSFYCSWCCCILIRSVF